ncbi:hypothetical protein ANN_01924 [Periplaneta americana]|uniref:Uncharacterized protein n=1 Tax=Periplaneta americana TaxID=6978 RepID=A0ABQ8TXU3_PERAM|nr:hypothetical protein ANN_01924 [Periplaneta americana]
MEPGFAARRANRYSTAPYSQTPLTYFLSQSESPSFTTIKNNRSNRIIRTSAEKGSTYRVHQCNKNDRLIPFDDLSLVTILPIMNVRYLSDYAMNYLALERKRPMQTSGLDYISTE